MLLTDDKKEREQMMHAQDRDVKLKNSLFQIPLSCFGKIVKSHFRAALCLCLKTSLGAQPFIFK